MSHPTAALRRDLGLLDAVAIGFGAIVGAGVYVLIGEAAGIAGPSFLLALLIAGAAAAANALSSAQLAAVYPFSGGTYEYGYRVLSPHAGFAAGWMFLASKIAAAGTVALGLGAYLEGVVPGLPPRTVAVAAMILFTFLGLHGVRRSSTANLAIVTLGVGALLVFVAAGAPSVRLGNLTPFTPGGWTRTLRAAAVIFFAYTGYARVATLAEEVREPHATIPRAIGITIAGAVVLYMAVGFVAVGTIGAGALAGTAAPLQRAARSFGGDAVSGIVTAGALVAMLGVILSQLLGLSRMAFAMARRGDLPAVLSTVDERHGVPRMATIAVGTAAVLTTALGTLGAIAAAAAFAILVYYAIANLAALRMPRELKRFPDAVPAFGLLACGLLALSLPVVTIAAGLALLAAGFLLRALARYS